MRTVERLKSALVRDRGARFVHLGNFEVEQDWAAGRPRLPGAGVSFTAATVNRLEELSVFLAGPHDVVILKQPLDAGYQAYLSARGVTADHVVCPEVSQPGRRVTQDALNSPQLLVALRELADGNTFLFPMGISIHEELLAAQTGLPIAGAEPAITQAVNSKVFSRALVARTGLREVPGTSCATVTELRTAVEQFLVPGRRIVIKEALGVDGRGLAVFDDLARAQRFVTMTAKRGPTVDVVVEQWVENITDLNYQFIIGRDGALTFETIKSAAVSSGVSRGHRYPLALPSGVVDEIHRAAAVIGEDLYAHGYIGMVGVDAMLTADGVLYPCLEINARLNMSNYQTAIAERLMPEGTSAEACLIELQLPAFSDFDEFIRPVHDLLMPVSGTLGVVVTTFATVNAEATGAGSFRGRLGVLCIGADAADAALLREQFVRRLQTEGIIR